MKLVIQRVSSACVVVENKEIAKIGQGILALVGIAKEDEEKELKIFAEKICNMRIFPDEKGRFQFSLLEIKGSLLLVPQFTLLADTTKGRRPEFFGAMAPEQAKQYFEKFAERCRESLLDSDRVQCGVFGADMKVSLLNDGPVTIVL